MGNVGISSVGTKSVNKTGQANKTECLAGRPYPQDTRETQLSPSGLTLCIPACAGHMIYFSVDE